MPSPQSPSSSLCCCLLPATIGHGLFAAPARDLPRNQPSIHRESPSNSTSRLRLASTISADACLTAPGCEGHASQIPIAPADRPATSRGFVHWRLSNAGPRPWRMSRAWRAGRHLRVGEDVAIPTPHSPGCADFPLPVLHERASLTGVWRWTIRAAGRGCRFRRSLNRSHGNRLPRRDSHFCQILATLWAYQPNRR